MIQSLPNKNSWVQEFVTTDRYKKISSAVKKFASENVVVTFDRKTVITLPRDRQFASNILDLQPFYILDFISNNTDKEIWDIGCGSNWFKEAYNIIGVDPYNDKADIKDSFDTNFIKKYKNSLDNAISICAIHFCSIDTLENRILSFIDLVKSGGFVYIAINFARVIDSTQIFLDSKSKIISNEKLISNLETMEEKLEIFKKSPEKVEEFIEDIVKKIKDNIILKEYSIKEDPDDALNGNFRILIQKR